MSSKFLAIVTVVAAFVAGVLVGAVGDRLYMLQRHAGPRHELAGRVMPHILNRLDRELDLTPQQREQIAKIMQERHRRVETFAGSVRPQIDAELRRANDEISRILTPAQREKFDKMKMRLLRPPRRHPPPPHAVGRG